MNSLTRAVLLSGMVLTLGACAQVAPWERGTLARPDMQVTPDPAHAALRAHVFDSKEASSGGRVGTGAGCGCN